MRNKYEIIAGKILEDVKSGKYSGKLPSEMSFARIYGTTNITAGRALNHLRDESVVVREKGKGTFVNPDFLKGEEVTYRFHRKDIYQDVLRALNDLLPNVKWKKAQGETKVESLRDSDISVQVTNFPAPYEKFFTPLPRGFVEERERERRYYRQPFEIHRGDSLYYGIPVIFSPFALVYNKKLLRDLGERDLPTTLRHEDMRRFESRLQEKNDQFLIVSDAFKHSTVMSHIFPSASAEGERNAVPARTTPVAISKGLKKMDALFRRGIEAGANFTDGNVLFSYACRQRASTLSDKQLDFPWDVCPLPSDVGGFRTVASESVMISATAARPDFITDVAKRFLSEEVQSVFAREQYGIPVLKSAAIDSLQDVGYRDDIFLTEARKAVFKYDFLPNSLLGTFKLLLNQYFNNEIPFERFRDDTLRLYGIGEFHKRNESVAIDLGPGME